MWHGLFVYNDQAKSLYEDCGIPRNRIAVIGMPSSIELLEPMDEGARKEFLKSRGLNPKRKTVLYAPTWNHNRKMGFFSEWWEDGKELARVDRLCKFIVNEMKANFIVRLHEKYRYSEDWLDKYKATFERYGVPTTYLEDDPNNLPYIRYSDIMVSDLSSIVTHFYVMDKPVVHIGQDPFSWKRPNGLGGIPLKKRAGHVITHFKELRKGIEASLRNPGEFSEKRREVASEYISFVGEDCRDKVIDGFRRIING
jgi:hypothetical protein